MIKAILMIYIFVGLLLTNIFNADLVVRGFSMAGAFGAGMFCFYFIFTHVNSLKTKDGK